MKLVIRLEIMQCNLVQDGSLIHAARGTVTRTNSLINKAALNKPGFVQYSALQDHFFIANFELEEASTSTRIEIFDSDKFIARHSFELPCAVSRDISINANNFEEFYVSEDSTLFVTLDSNLLCGITTDAITLDTDQDTINDVVDNCPANSNTNQLDLDGDGIGDICDAYPDDASNGEVIDFNSIQITLGFEGHKMLFDESRNQIYVSIPSRNEIVIIDANSLMLKRRLHVGSMPRGLNLSIDNSKLYVALNGAQSLAVVDLNNFNISELVISQFGFPNIWGVIEQQPNKLFVSLENGGVLQVNLDATGEIISSIPLGVNGIIFGNEPDFGLTQDKNTLYVFSLRNTNVFDVSQEIPIFVNDFEFQGTKLEISPNEAFLHLGGGIRSGSNVIVRTDTYEQAFMLANKGISRYGSSIDYFYQLVFPNTVPAVDSEVRVL